MPQVGSTEVIPLTPIEQRVFAICLNAAEEGRELDSTARMAEVIGGDHTNIPRVLARLETKGWITRSTFQRGRQIMIAATGKWTAPPRNTTPHWRSVLAVSRDSTPTLPRHTIARSVPTLMSYLDRMMRDENMTLETAQMALMARGMQHREEERTGQ